MNRPWFGVIAIALAGCSLMTPLPAEPTKEVLQQLPAALPQAPSGDAVLLVTMPVAEPLYDTTRMAYTRRKFEVSYFNDTEWAEKPARMIQELLARSLQGTGHFSRVITPPDFSAWDLALGSQLLALNQDYTASPPVLHAAMRFELDDRRSGSVIASREMRVDQPIQGEGAHAGVVAANEAMARIMRDAALFVVENGAPGHP